MNSHQINHSTYFKKVEKWLQEGKEILGPIANWIGIYFKAEYLDSTIEKKDYLLVLGPYIGKDTDHREIPISKGLCGKAVRENRIINVDDVHQEEEHIACSLSTNSELIIPLYDHNNLLIGELDIDSDTPSAFSKEIENKMKEFCRSFPLNESDHESSKQHFRTNR
jgi:GAF domain-containing protein